MFKKLLLGAIATTPLLSVISCGEEKINPFSKYQVLIDDVFAAKQASVDYSFDDAQEFIKNNDAISILNFISLLGEDGNELDIVFDSNEIDIDIQYAGITLDTPSSSFDLEFLVRLKKVEEAEYTYSRNYFINVLTSDTNLAVKHFLEEVNGINRQSNLNSEQLALLVSNNPFAFQANPTTSLDLHLDHIVPIQNHLDETEYHINGARLNATSYINDVYIVNFNLYKTGKTSLEDVLISQVQYALISKDI